VTRSIREPRALTTRTPILEVEEAILHDWALFGDDPGQTSCTGSCVRPEAFTRWFRLKAGLKARLYLSISEGRVFSLITQRRVLL
jgi:hypothetical protein